jgi:hypothetical protein
VVVPKPPALEWTVAGSILSVGGTAAHALQVAAAKPGETLLVHGAAGGVGQIAVQLAVQDGVRVIGTARESNHDLLRGYGVIPVTYGPGLADRVRALAPDGVDAAIDMIGTDEAVDTSLELVADHHRIVSIAAFGRADSGIVLISGDDPETHVRARPGAGCWRGRGRLSEGRRSLAPIPWPMRRRPCSSFATGTPAGRSCWCLNCHAQQRTRIRRHSPPARASRRDREGRSRNSCVPRATCVS